MAYTSHIAFEQYTLLPNVIDPRRSISRLVLKLLDLCVAVNSLVPYNIVLSVVSPTHSLSHLVSFLSFPLLSLSSHISGF